MRLHMLRMGVLVCGVLVAATVSAQTNVIKGTTGIVWPEGKRVIFAPDPEWWQTTSNLKNQWCWLYSDVWDGTFPGGANQLAFVCHTAYNETNGAWNVMYRGIPFAGKNRGHYEYGFEFGAEGQIQLDGAGNPVVDANGHMREQINRIYLWEFDPNDPVGGRTIFAKDLKTPNRLNFGENSHPLDIWATGRAEANGPLYSHTALQLDPRGDIPCDAAHRFWMRMTAGVPGATRDGVQFCGMSSSGAYAWRVIY